MTNKPLSTQPYKGARDFYPEDKRVQKYMFSTLRMVAERFGYEEYDAPILEPTELYLSKGNQEIIDEQTYTFEDRGKRSVTIRTEMTPTVSRLVAGRRQELAYPLRWYSIPNLWRYERPQRGRLREFWQLNVDIFGVGSVDAEFELLLLIDNTMKAFGARPDMYELKLNSRQLVDAVLTGYLGLSADESLTLVRLIDKMNKLSRDDFIAKVDAAIHDTARESGVTEKLLTVLDAKRLEDLPADLQQIEPVQDLRSVLTQLEAAGVTNAVFDVTIMRGFDYYTGIVFEVFDTDPENNRAMLGGGRYDGLVGLFGVAPIPTVGFGWGDVTMENFLRSHRLMPDLKSETDVYVALVGNVNAQAQLVVAELRAGGLNVAVDVSGRKLGDQFKTADKKGVANVLIIGEAELTSGEFKLKNLTTGDEATLNIKAIVDQLA
jgi:histidyl-tRNA synthetase